MVFAGLPLHVLLVHFVIVLVPLASLCTVLAAAWPAVRRRLGIVSPLLALAVVILVPITTNAGEWLQSRVGQTPLVQAHTALGAGLLPWTIGVLVVAVVVWGWHTFAVPKLGIGRRGLRASIAIVLSALAIVAAAGATTQVILIGESGSRAVWENSFTAD